MSPKISVVVPVYNAGKYLRQNIESLLGQSLRDIEIICIDEGSDDESREILEEYARKDSRLRILTQDHRSIPDARNMGLQAAEGEYVHFCEAEDYCLDYAYEALYNKLRRYDLDFLNFCSIVLDESTGETLKNDELSLTGLGAGDFHRLLSLSQPGIICRLSMPSFAGLYRRSFLVENDIRFDSTGYFHDRSFFWHVVTASPRMMACKDRLIVHRVNKFGSDLREEAAHFACLAESFQFTEKHLQEGNVSADALEQIVAKEASYLTDCCKKYMYDEEFGEQVVLETRRFFEKFQYYAVDEPYQELSSILKNRQKFCKLLADGVSHEEAAAKVKGKTPAPVYEDVFRDECIAPKVSVVVPIYNQEEYLNQALESLTRQTLAEMEFVCVNDGSKDESMTILKEYAAVDKRFRIIDKENSGYGDSMNIGIDAARGEYLGILEPDDYVPGDMYERLCKTASEHHVEIIKADYYRFKVLDNGVMAPKLIRLSSKRSYYNRIVDPSEETEVFLFMMNTWAGIYRLDFLNKWNIRHNTTPGASFQDLGFWFQTFVRARKIWFVDTPMYMYRRDNPNASMLSSGNPDGEKNEFKFIWNYLNQDPGLLDKYGKIFYYKKFSAYSMAYYRIPDQLKRDYVHLMYDEFKKPMEEGWLDEQIFEPRLWCMLNEILEDPDAYYEKLRLSVIIPVYNAERTLRQCLNSFLFKDEIRSEIICIDDGSTDGSLEILREYEAKDSRVTVIHQDHTGDASCKNTGIGLAKGEYLLFLNANDFYDSDMFRLSYERAHTDSCDVVVFQSDLYNECSRTYSFEGAAIRTELLPSERPFAGTDIVKNFYDAFAAWPWDKLFRTEFVRENNLSFLEQPAEGDLSFVYSALAKASRISLVNANLAHHRIPEMELRPTDDTSGLCVCTALESVKKQLEDFGLFAGFEHDFTDFALHYSLQKLNAAKGKTYEELYKGLKKKWLKELGIAGRGPLYFSDRSEYGQLQHILSDTAKEFLYTRMAASQSGVVSEKDMLKLQEEIADLKAERQELWAVKRERGLEIQQLKREKKNAENENRKLRQSAAAPAYPDNIVFRAEMKAYRIMKKGAKKALKTPAAVLKKIKNAK